MSFLSKLFGAPGGATAPAKAAAEEEYKGYLIKATPTAVGGEHQMAVFADREDRGHVRLT